jgi:hypothetical protein
VAVFFAQSGRNERPSETSFVLIKKVIAEEMVALI